MLSLCCGWYSLLRLPVIRVGCRDAFQSGGRVADLLLTRKRTKKNKEQQR